MLIMVWSTRGYNSLDDPLRQHEIFRKILLQADPIFFSTYLTNFDTKITKMKRNYTANMIMNVSGTVCQLSR